MVRRVLTLMGALVSAGCGAVVLWDVTRAAIAFYPFLQATTGSGGIGAVSVDAGAQVSIAVLGLLAAVVTNRVLAKRARGGRLRILHRIHSALLLAIGFGIVLLVLAIPFGGYLTIPGELTMGLLTLAAIGVQFLVLAVLRLGVS